MKTKSRLGKADIFASTASAPSTGTAVEAPLAGASSAENKLTVIIPPNQVAFLDRLCLDIRTKTRAKVRRTEIIRALVAALQVSGLDLTTAASEADMVHAIAKRLKPS